MRCVHQTAALILAIPLEPPILLANKEEFFSFKIDRRMLGAVRTGVEEGICCSPVQCISISASRRVQTRDWDAPLALHITTYSPWGAVLVPLRTFWVTPLQTS